MVSGVSIPNMPGMVSGVSIPNMPGNKV